MGQSTAGSQVQLKLIRRTRADALLGTLLALERPGLDPEGVLHQSPGQAQRSPGLEPVGSAGPEGAVHALAQMCDPFRVDPEGISVPRAALRLPWALELDPVGVTEGRPESLSSDDVSVSIAPRLAVGALRPHVWRTTRRCVCSSHAREHHRPEEIRRGGERVNEYHGRQQSNR